MKPIAGLNRDINPINQPEDTMRYAANGVISETTGLAQNIRDEFEWELFANTHTFVGWALGEKLIYVWMWNSAGQGEIWRFDPDSAGSKVLVLIDPNNILELEEEAGLAPFLTGKYLQIVYQQDFEEGEVFAWAGQTKPKIIDIGTLTDEWLTDGGLPLPINLNGDVGPPVIDPWTENEFLLFPEGELFNPDIEAKNSGGSVRSGAWMFAYRYVNEDGSVTSFSGVSNPVYISEDSFDKDSTFQGDPGNRPTTKSIEITIQYDDGQRLNDVRIQFGYISIREGVVFAGILDSKGLSSMIVDADNAIYTYSGEQPAIDLGDDISEIITPKGIYNHIGTITTLTSRLYTANLTQQEEENIQEIANAITSEWVYEEYLSTRKGDNLNRPTFGAGEVYALYISALYSNGSESRGFHIPGRKFKEDIPGSPETTATGSYQITGGPSAGGFVVGFNYGAFILSVSPANGDTNLVAATALIAFINGSAAAVTASDGGGGLINLVADVAGTAGNVTISDLANDPAFTTTPTGVSGGTAAVPAQDGDDVLVLPPENHNKWQIFDTVTGVTEGETGYWVNQGESYPNQLEFDSAKDITGPYLDNVRHHKMPSIGYLMNSGAMSTANADTPELSIRLSNIDFSSLPAGSNIIGYNIYYAKKEIGELVNYCYDWPTPVGAFPDGLNARVAISGGFGYSDQDPAAVPGIATDVIAESTMMKFHATFLLDKRPAINPLYFVKEAYTEVPGIGVQGIVVDSDIYTDLRGIEVTLGSAYKYGAFDDNLWGGDFIPVEADRYIAIDDFAYVNNGVKWSFGGHSLDNNAGEDAFVVYNTAGFDGVGGVPIVKVPLERFAHTAKATATFAALRAIPANISSPFDSQTLNFAGSFKKIGGGPEVALVDHKHGDTYNGDYQFNTTGVAGMGPDALGVDPNVDTALIDTTTDENGMFKGEGSKMVYIVNSQSPINHVSQYADPSDVQSYIADIQGGLGPTDTIKQSLPFNEENKAKLKAWYFWDQDIYQSFTILYNDDFHRRSEYFIQGINDGYFRDDTRLPTTIAFSLRQPTSIQIRQWRNWLLLNKYVQPSEKGEIVNLKGAGNQMLYIHHRYSLYTTKDRLTLDAGPSSVTLGSGDIFEVTPYEIVSVVEGHTGLQNRHWQTLSPFGYSWIQTDHGKVYTHDGQSLEELSGQGMRIFFRDNIEDNFPDQDNRYMIINDDLKRRIIVGLQYSALNSRDLRTTTPDPLEPIGDLGHTLAFSTAAKAWSFFQNRNVPFAIVARDKNVFSIVENDEGEYRILGVARGSYNNLKRPFIVEAVVNDQTSNHKYLQFIKWNTNVWVAGASDTTWFDQEIETFNKIVLYSDTKIYGLPNVGVDDWDNNLVPYQGFPKGGQNVRRLEDNWSFNDFRDISKDGIAILRNAVDNIGPNPAAVDLALTWDQKSRIRDKYMIVRLFYHKDNSNRVELESIQFGVKPSFR